MKNTKRRRHIFQNVMSREKSLHYVEIPEEIPDDAGHVRSYLSLT